MSRRGRLLRVETLADKLNALMRRWGLPASWIAHEMAPMSVAQHGTGVIFTETDLAASLKRTHGHPEREIAQVIGEHIDRGVQFHTDARRAEEEKRAMRSIIGGPGYMVRKP